MKPVYMKKSNVIKMEISLPKPLPFQVSDVVCMRLTKLTRCSVDLHITAEKAEAELLEVSSYIERFVSRHMQLKIFMNHCRPSMNRNILSIRFWMSRNATGRSRIRVAAGISGALRLSAGNSCRGNEKIRTDSDGHGEK